MVAQVNEIEFLQHLQMIFHIVLIDSRVKCRMQPRVSVHVLPNTLNDPLVLIATSV